MKNILDNKIPNLKLSILIILSITLTVAPHVIQIHLSVIALFLLCSVFKLIALKSAPILSSRLVIILLAVIAFSNSAWHYGIPLGRDPGVSFLICLLGLKILESKTTRDARIVLILSYFMVVTHFLYFASFPIVVFLFAMVVVITWLLVQLGHVEPDKFYREDFHLVRKLVVQAIPFTLILFFLFPRFAGSLWLLQSPSNTSTTGMSNTLSMGSFSNLVESEEIAFTATFDDAIPPHSARYWRAGVFWETDGETWSKGKKWVIDERKVQFTGEFYNYEIDNYASNSEWLYTLDIPAEAPQFSALSTDNYLTKALNDERFNKYQVKSYIRYSDKTIDDNVFLSGTALPDGVITKRLENFVSDKKIQASTQGNLDTHKFANSLMKHFNENEFSYTLSPRQLISSFPIDEFLFDSQEGFCEHYSASFATLMRAAGVPARIVVGYLGGEYNPRANQIVVRQSDAHAWTEYWHEEDGWIRADPTAAIAPERVENRIDFNQSLNANGRIQFSGYDLGFLGNLIREARWTSALFKVQWDRWFVGYDNTRQKVLLRSLNLDKIDLIRLSGIAFFIAIGILSLIAFFNFRNERYRPEKELILYQKFCKKIEKLGIKRHSYEGPRDFLDRCKTHLISERTEYTERAQSALILELEEINQQYIQQRYTNVTGKERLISLERLIKKLNIA